MKRQQIVRHLLRAVTTLLLIVSMTGFVYLVHSKPLTAGLIDLVLVMLIAFRWGFIQAAIASVFSVACMDYFYMAPVFSLYERDPQDWISSGIFVTIALTAGHFADRIKQKATQTENERTRLEKLYLTSRDIIVMDRRREVGAQLASLIADTFKVEAVALWDAREARMDKAGKGAIPDDEVRATYFHELSENNLDSRKFKRVLRLGTSPVGALYIADSSSGAPLDARS